MLKFLEQLSKAKDIYTEMPSDTDAERRYQKMKELYSKVVGKRALYIDKVGKESRVIHIEKANDSFIIAKYNCYGMTYQKQLSVCIQYSSILCGDARVEIE